MIEFLNSLDCISVVFGLLLAYICNLILSLEQLLLEKWALTYQKKKAIIDERKQKI